VAPGPLAAAVTYARDKQWPVDVDTVQSTEGSLAGRRILQRTPWVFALDEDGRVIREGHGSRLQAVARSLGAGSVERETADPIGQ